MENARLTVEQKSSLSTLTEKVLVSSSLEFLKATNGIRPGEFSVLVGKEGNGKSSLLKTMAIESCMRLVKTLCLLSEERTDIYKMPIDSAIRKYVRKSPDKFFDSLYLDSMLQWDKCFLTLDGFFTKLEDMIRENEFHVIIFDNFTTSFLGELPIGQQSEAIRRFKIIAITYEIAIVGVFHTKKDTDIYKKLLSGEDVRGTGTTTNAGSYNYILTTYFNAEPPFTLLFIDKARYHPSANKTYWYLQFDKDTGLYLRDQKTSFKEAQTRLAVHNQQMKELSKGRSSYGKIQWS